MQMRNEFNSALRMSRVGLVHPSTDAQIIRLGGRRNEAIIAIPARNHGVGRNELQIIHALPEFDPGETIRERVLKIKIRARNEFLIW